MRGEATSAIVLRTFEFGESDKIVTLLTRSAGKLTGIAKGGKRSQRRFGGALELFSHVWISYRQRAGAELAFLERATFVAPWRHLLDSLERYAAASHVVEVADRMTAEREIGDHLYATVVAALERLDRAEPGPLTLRLFELAVLTACGYRHDFGVCAGCRLPLASGEAASAAEGGLVCARCVPPGAAALGPLAVELLGRLQQAASLAVPPGEWRGATPPGDPFEREAALASGLEPGVASQLRGATSTLLAPYLRGRLRALDLLSPVLGRRSGAS